MARLVGVDIPENKRLEVALTYIFGVGPSKAREILNSAKIGYDARISELNEDQILAIRDYIRANVKFEGDLRREVASDIRRKIEIKSYQGSRHRSGLPVRGQHTKTNARTRKGKRRTVAGKKKV